MTEESVFIDKTLKRVVIGFLIFFFSVFFIIFWNKGKSSRLNKRKIAWKKEMQSKGIKSLSIVLQRDYLIAKSEDILRYWKKVKNIYINGEKTAPDKIYKKEDFSLEHCGKYYTLLTNKDIDSIVYKFPPQDQYEEYFEGKLINKSRDFYKKRKYHKRYVKWLPECK